MADAGQIGNLCAGIGNGLDKNHTRFRTKGRLHLIDIRGIDKAEFTANTLQRAKEAGGVAKEELAGNHMVASPQE